jgi:CheY-like chemotaxis protein
MVKSISGKADEGPAAGATPEEKVMKTILVAGDEFDLTGTLRSILEGEGYRTEVCANGQEALAQLESSKPDLLLMDVMMPFVSGIEVLRTMRHTPDLDRVPVILMSAEPPGVKREDYGWQAFLRKPFSLNALVRTVEGLIGKAEGERPASAGC